MPRIDEISIPLRDAGFGRWTFDEAYDLHAIVDVSGKPEIVGYVDDNGAHVRVPAIIAGFYDAWLQSDDGEKSVEYWTREALETAPSAAESRACERYHMMKDAV